MNETDPRIVTGQNLHNKEQLLLTNKLSNEKYLKKCGFLNTIAIGLPVVYLKKIKIERIKGSLLVMPSHSLDYTTHNCWKFDEYVSEIDKIAKYFKHIYICVHPSCLKKGYWVDQFQAKGYKIIEGMSIDDKNALKRLQYLLSTFEYVTTNSYGSHIAYASYFGAKVSIYGTYAEYKTEDYVNDPFYKNNNDILDKTLDLKSYESVKKYFEMLFVEPQEAVVRTEWGEYEVGEDCKKDARTLRKILGWTYFKSNIFDLKFNIKRLRGKFQVRTRIKKLIPNFLKHYYRLQKYPEYKFHIDNENEIGRINKIVRFSVDSTNLLGQKVKFVDSASFLFIYDELFNKEIYKFKSDNDQPYIIDAGANIGLGIIYYKKLYPNAEIVAFEPDNKVFEVLEYNINSFEFSNVKLIKKALWNEETTLKFYSEGVDGGRIANDQDNKQIIEISTCRLRAYLNRKVDLLKIDIEGAEITVLEDCKDLLHNVDRLFVEYHSFTNKSQNLSKIITILEKHNFRIYITVPGLLQTHPFVKIDDYAGMDLQLNIFAIKIK